MKPLLNVEDIRALLPHRFPMLLVDRVLELTPGERIVGLKNVTINEPYFNGHFPGQAIMPGVLILEAMAQVAGLMILSLPTHRIRPTTMFTLLLKLGSGTVQIGLFSRS